MKTAAVALRGLLSQLAASIGLEGGFLILGTLSLAIFASAIHPAGPWLVIGVISILVSVALTMPTRRQ